MHTVVGVDSSISRILFECLHLLLFIVVRSLNCVQLCDPMNCSTPGFPLLIYLPEFAQTHVHWVSDATNHLTFYHPFSSCPQSFPASGPSTMSRLFASDSRSPGASASFFPVNIQGCFPIGLTDLISLQSERLSSTTVQKLQFFIVYL